MTRDAGLGSWSLATEHVGITVESLDDSIAFWTALTGAEVHTRRTLEKPYIGRLVGYRDIRIEMALLELAGGLMLELLHYCDRDEVPYEPGTAHPGNVHLCFLVEDMKSSWGHAVTCGATPTSPEPVRIPSGPQRGGFVAYLQTPDGMAIELRQLAPVSRFSSPPQKP